MQAGLELFRRFYGMGVAVCLVLVAGAPPLLAVANFGVGLDLWDWRFGMHTLAFGWGGLAFKVMLAAGAASLALAVFLKIRDGAFHLGLGVVIAALVLGAAGVAGLTWLRGHLGAFPAAHDVATDPQNPPVFTAFLIQRRGAQANPVGRPSPEGSAGLRPVIVAEDPDAAFAAALRTARGLGWRVGTTSAEARMFEATVESIWFGFIDDVAVRVTGDEAGARIDLRVAARSGGSDYGRGAALIAAFGEALAERLAADASPGAGADADRIPDALPDVETEAG
ncbi:MAG: DUF1499 domain-containing protein [Maricaulaceae bacterium]|nr:DUF1499 domain-containing protein [Maricaulaceae bacterium]